MTFILFLERGSVSTREGNGTPLQYLPGKSHGRKSLEGCSPWGRWGSDTTEGLHFHALEKEMATHSSVLDWRLPGTGEPGGLPSVGSHRVGHDWSDLAATAAAAYVLHVDGLRVQGLSWLMAQATRNRNLGFLEIFL